MPGGPESADKADAESGWPETSIELTVVRLGLDLGPDNAATYGPGGKFSPAFNLYESAETVLLLADPRARMAPGGSENDRYTPQELSGDAKEGDEESQCRRCEWPSFLPDPGDLMLAVTDKAVAGRGLPFSFVRTYRSSNLGFGPLGCAGWSSPVFAHLRELPITGEVGRYDPQPHSSPPVSTEGEAI